MNRYLFLAILAGMLAGCYSNSTLVAPPAPIQLKSQDHSSGIPKLPALIKLSFSGDSNYEGEVAALTDAISSSVRNSGLFSSLSFTNQSSSAATSGSVLLDFDVRSSVDRKSGANLAKTLAVCLSAFTLTPVLPLTVSRNDEFSLTVVWPHGTRHNYVQSCRSEGVGVLFRQKVTNSETAAESAKSCSNSVVNQISSSFVKDSIEYQEAVLKAQELAAKRSEEKSLEVLGDCKKLGFKPDSADFKKCVNQLSGY